MKGDEQPVWYELPRSLVIEVPITHPDIEAFSDLELKWYGVPIISDMKLEVGAFIIMPRHLTAGIWARRSERETSQMKSGTTSSKSSVRDRHRR